MKTKADAKIEAARLAIDSEAENFTEKAAEIYSFLTDGIDMPDVEVTFDPSSLVNKYFSANPPLTPASDEEKREETAKA